MPSPLDERPMTEQPSAPGTLRPHPDRLLPSDPVQRAIARRLLAEVADLPLVSPHGHVDAGLFARDTPFTDPAELFVTPDHYVTRMLYSAGVALESLGVPRLDGRGPATDSRSVWRELCSHWHLFRGTPSRLWLEHELHELFGVEVRPSAATADEIHDLIAARLATPEFRPRALYRRFNLETLATTDAPDAALADHRALADDPDWHGNVIPTFRPDAVADPGRPDWRERVAALGQAADVDTSTYTGYITALENRRGYFRAHGATSTDHGFPTANTAPLGEAAAERLYREAMTVANSGEPLPAASAESFRGHMLHEFARMSCDDGLVMQLHPGVCRDHHRAVHAAFGPDRGGDIPVATEFTQGLRPLLDDFGRHSGFTVVVFTVDETAYSRELAPLAGHYPAMRLGAPWWFLDAPEAIQRFRADVTETAGFYNTAGFVDDTRAFCSIPARHDVARRLDCAYLARLVAEHRLPEDEARETAVDLAYRLPKQTFRV